MESKNNKKQDFILLAIGIILVLCAGIFLIFCVVNVSVTEKSSDMDAVSMNEKESYADISPTAAEEDKSGGSGEIADSGPDSEAKVHADNIFAGFRCEDMDGTMHSSDEFAGAKVTLINIWSTFCGPCVEEMPDLDKLSKDYSDKGLQVFGVCADLWRRGKKSEDKADEARTILEGCQVTYPVLFPDEQLQQKLDDNIFTYPTTYLIDENGEVLTVIQGSKSLEKFEELINSFGIIS